MNKKEKNLNNSFFQKNLQSVKQFGTRPGPNLGYKSFFKLNLTEHEI